MFEIGTSMIAQWLRLCAPNAGGLGSIPAQGTISPMRAATKEPTCHNWDPAQPNKYINNKKRKKENVWNK